MSSHLSLRPHAVVGATLLAVGLACTATPSAHAATWTACSGNWGGVDFTSISATTTNLVAVNRSFDGVQKRTWLKRTTAASCNFVVSKTDQVPGLTAIPASSGTTVVASSLPGKNLLSQRVIGKSVQGRDITAYLVGDPNATRTQMLLGSMHGDEPAGKQTLMALVNGPKISGVKIWVVPTMNPDGLVLHTRQNAHGVDLNGNFPVSWVSSTPGYRYYTGPKPLSEPESRAMLAFVQEIKPEFLVSIHQPLFCVDSEDVKSQPLHDALVGNLGLPSKWAGANKSGSRGTLTNTVNSTLPTAMITIEYGAAPSNQYIEYTARRGLVASVGGSYSAPLTPRSWTNVPKVKPLGALGR